MRGWGWATSAIGSGSGKTSMIWIGLTLLRGEGKSRGEMRGAMLVGRTLSELGAPLLALIAFTLVLSPLSVLALRRAINYLRETGSLSQY